MTDALNIALDRFDVPPMSAGLTDRIVAATTPSIATTTAAPRRDRRGMWRRGRQVVVGSLAVGLLSAGAIASGLLGRVGIEVPVLTAMLAPKPMPVVPPVRVAKVRTTAQVKVAPKPPVAVPPQTMFPVLLLPIERIALREDRRERRRAFAADHPVAAAVIRQRVREELQRRAWMRREALLASRSDQAMPDASTLDDADRLALRRAARRDRMIAERMIDRRIEARTARWSPEERAQFELQIEQRRAAREALSADTETNDTSEGIPESPR